MLFLLGISLVAGLLLGNNTLMGSHSTELSGTRSIVQMRMSCNLLNQLCQHILLVDKLMALWLLSGSSDPLDRACSPRYRRERIHQWRNR